MLDSSAHDLCGRHDICVLAYAAALHGPQPAPAATAVPQRGETAKPTSTPAAAMCGPESMHSLSTDILSTCSTVPVACAAEGKPGSGVGGGGQHQLQHSNRHVRTEGAAIHASVSMSSGVVTATQATTQQAAPPNTSDAESIFGTRSQFADESSTHQPQPWHLQLSDTEHSSLGGHRGMAPSGAVLREAAEEAVPAGAEARLPSRGVLMESDPPAIHKAAHAASVAKNVRGSEAGTQAAPAKGDGPAHGGGSSAGLSRTQADVAFNLVSTNWHS